MVKFYYNLNGAVLDYKGGQVIFIIVGQVTLYFQPQTVIFCRFLRVGRKQKSHSANQRILLSLLFFKVVHESTGDTRFSILALPTELWRIVLRVQMYDKFLKLPNYTETFLLKKSIFMPTDEKLKRIKFLSYVFVFF